MKEPTVGRIVHFYGTMNGASGEVASAAIITAVHEREVVDLYVFAPMGPYAQQNVPVSDVPAPNRWSWPPREGP